jgi:hypothetical protein
MRNCGTSTDSPSDWIEIGRLVLAEAVRRTSNEILRREDELRRVARGERSEVLS